MGAISEFIWSVREVGREKGWVRWIVVITAAMLLAGCAGAISRVELGPTQPEVCVNDERLDDNTGAWGIDIWVDESQAP